MEIRCEAALKPSPDRDHTETVLRTSATQLSLSEAASQPVCVQPFHLQHTVYNLCYKSSEHADYRLYKPQKALLSEFQA